MALRTPLGPGSCPRGEMPPPPFPHLRRAGGGSEEKLEVGGAERERWGRLFPDRRCARPVEGSQSRARGEAVRAELLSPPPRWKVDLLPAGRKGLPALLPAGDRFHPPPSHGRKESRALLSARRSCTGPSPAGRTDGRTGGGGRRGGGGRARGKGRGPRPAPCFHGNLTHTPRPPSPSPMATEARRGRRAGERGGGGPEEGKRRRAFRRTCSRGGPPPRDQRRPGGAPEKPAERSRSGRAGRRGGRAGRLLFALQPRRRRRQQHWQPESARTKSQARLPSPAAAAAAAAGPAGKCSPAARRPPTPTPHPALPCGLLLPGCTAAGPARMGRGRGGLF